MAAGRFRPPGVSLGSRPASMPLEITASHPIRKGAEPCPTWNTCGTSTGGSFPPRASSSASSPALSGGTGPDPGAVAAVSPETGPGAAAARRPPRLPCSGRDRYPSSSSPRREAGRGAAGAASPPRPANGSPSGPAGSCYSARGARLPDHHRGPGKRRQSRIRGLGVRRSRRSTGRGDTAAGEDRPAATQRSAIRPREVRNAQPAAGEIGRRYTASAAVE